MASPPQRHRGHYALTFDDGPCDGSTDALLQALDAVGAVATMFNLGSRAHRHPTLVRDQVAAGHSVGNHTRSHFRLPLLSDDEVRRELASTQRTVQVLTGRLPTLFRPPYGDTDERVAAAASEHGLTEVLWTVDSRDWAGASADEIVAAAQTLEPGGVLLLHDGYDTTIEAVPRIVTTLAQRGLAPGVVCQLTGQAIAGP